MNGVIGIGKLAYAGIFFAIAASLTACIGVAGTAPEVRVGPSEEVAAIGSEEVAAIGSEEVAAIGSEEVPAIDDDSILEVDIDPVFTENGFIGLTFSEAKVLADDLGFFIYHQRADVQTDSIKDDSKWVAVRLDENGLVEWAKVPG